MFFYRGWQILLTLLLITSLSGAERTKIASAAIAATVGVYSSLGENDRYYGSGVIISADGYILTSTTAAPIGAREIEIYFSDHQKTTARVVVVQAEIETVLLKVERQNLSFLPLRLTPPEVGEDCFTCGNANNMLKLGDSASFSAGIVSGIYEIENADSQSSYHGAVIETDAAVNPGQDGGALIDSNGEIIGIISRGFSLTRWQGVAVPTTVILEKLPEISRLAANNSSLAIMANSNRWQKVVALYRPALVALEVQRRFPSEILPRENWRKFAEQKIEAEKDPAIRRRLTADFFTADSLLAANQMVRRPAGAVSGVMVSSHGHILTSVFNVQANDRVFVDWEHKIVPPPRGATVVELLKNSTGLTVQDNSPVRVIATLADGRKFSAEIIAFNLPLGLAMLKISETTNLAYLDLEAAARAPQTGEDIVLLGAAPPTLNHGMVSANSRYADYFFQFDARLNYANSGGVVLAESGHFLGLAGAPLNPAPVAGKILPFTAHGGGVALANFINSPNSGVGLATTAARIKEALPQLMNGAEITLNQPLKFGIKPVNAYAPQIEVAEVRKNSPAEISGLRAGDTIMAVDNLGLRSWKEINDYLNQQPAGRAIALLVRRADGSEKELYLKWE